MLLPLALVRPWAEEALLCKLSPLHFVLTTA